MYSYDNIILNELNLININDEINKQKMYLNNINKVIENYDVNNEKSSLIIEYVDNEKFVHKINLYFETNDILNYINKIGLKLDVNI